MISTEKKLLAIEAIQSLIVQGRTMAYEGVPNDELAKFLDDLEYLPGLMLEKLDRSEQFSEYLKGICEKYDCNRIHGRFSSGR